MHDLAWACEFLGHSLSKSTHPISFLSFLNQFFILEEISMEAGLAYYKFSLVFLSNTCIAVFELEAKTISWKSHWIFPPASDNASLWFIAFTIEIQSWKKIDGFLSQIWDKLSLDSCTFKVDLSITWRCLFSISAKSHSVSVKKYVWALAVAAVGIIASVEHLVPALEFLPVFLRC